jgi:methylthioribose-1-phosphate isomerase
MKVSGKAYRTLWFDPSGTAVQIIDQTRLPHELSILSLTRVDQVAHAIQSMQVRGAPLIGVAAAFGLALAAREDPSDSAIEAAAEHLLATRPTAVNLRWALAEMRRALSPLPSADRAAAARRKAQDLADEDVETCRRIGEHAARLMRELWEEKGRPARLNVLTHCNAGWLATVDWGTALSGIYQAHDSGLPIHVWVDETRPRNQGLLTAWELGQHGVDHTVIVDNAGGHLMQHGKVDLCIVGSDRTTARGDVCNKVGTYLKALAARDNQLPFYAALPRSTIDFSMDDGLAEIPIEERHADEVHRLWGKSESGHFGWVRSTPMGTAVANPGFDVTPARLITGIITEQGVAPATREGLLALYPEERR